MKILVVFTGGTIGSVMNDGVLSVHHSPSNFYLIERYLEHTGKDINFETIMPLNLQSENMTIADINTLIHTLKSMKLDDFDGVIVTHGTDTLAYTANFLAIFFRDIRIPMVIVSSNYSLYDERCNGHENFSGAVDFIEHSDLYGVYCIFRQHGNTQVLLASEITQCRPYTHTFESGCIGYMQQGSFVRTQPSPLPLGGEPIKTAALKPCVLIIKPYVGMNIESYDVGAFKAVLYQTYHSCTAGGEILKLKQMCEKTQTNLYVAPFRSAFFYSNDCKYTSIDVIIKNNIHALCDITLEAAYAWLTLAYSMYPHGMQAQRFLEFTNLFLRG